MSSSETAQKIFDRVMAQMKVKLGAEAFSSWFGRMKLAEHSKGIVRLSVPTAFLRAWINNHYVNTINDLWDGSPLDSRYTFVLRRRAVKPRRLRCRARRRGISTPARTLQSALSARLGRAR
jgi:chromosomal replication initiator protein